MQADYSYREDLDLAEIAADIDRLRAEVERTSEGMRSELDSAISDVRASADAIHIDLRNERESLRVEMDELEQRQAVTTSEGEATAMQLEIRDLKLRMQSLSVEGSESGDKREANKRSTKRWAAHLPLPNDSAAPQPDVLELPLGYPEHTES